MGIPRGPAAALRMFANSVSMLVKGLREGEEGGDLWLPDLALSGRWLRPAVQAGTMFSKRAKLSAKV